MHVGSFTIFTSGLWWQLISFSAVISFLGAFFLIRYKLEVADQDEEEAHEDSEMVDSPISVSSDPIKRRFSTSQARPRGRVRVHTSPENPVVYSTNPRLVQVGPFRTKAPTELLSRCHSLCVFLTFLGFLFAITGLLSFAWNGLPMSIGVGASVSMSVCFVAAILILVFPFSKIPHHLRT